MSAQAGQWNRNGRRTDVESIDRLSSLLASLGPDGEERFTDGSVFMLYRPFHTTRESRLEKQPQLSRRGFLITWDGRLDNREELIELLELPTDVDDVTIVAGAFDRWQTESFSKLIGDWATAVWIPADRQLILAVDFMSVRHLFYSVRGDEVRWCTDLSPLVLMSDGPLDINDEYLAGYLAHESESHVTPYLEIQQVPAGHFAVIGCNDIKIKRHWNFRASTRIRYRIDEEYEEHFLALFRQSVKRRIRSDSPILAELSGGLDSSSIVCMADTIVSRGDSNSTVDTLSYFDNTEPDGDDCKYFPIIEEQRGRRGTHIDVSSSNSTFRFARGEFSPLPGAHELSSAETARIELRITKGYRVSLSGLGGDEFMGGIPDPRSQLADLLLQGRLASLGKELFAWSVVKRRPMLQLFWQAVVEICPAFIAVHFSQLARPEKWLSKSFVNRMKIQKKLLVAGEYFQLLLPSRRSFIGGLNIMANRMAKHLGNRKLYEEMRYPFLDQSLLEFLLAIPATQLLRPGERRSLMRRSLVGILPEPILFRKTKQVAARSPLLAIQSDLQYLRDLFGHSITSQLSITNPRAMDEVLSGTPAGASLPIVRLFKVIALEQWLQDMYRLKRIRLPGASDVQRPTASEQIALGA